jgi:hypothetical protein
MKIIEVPGRAKHESALQIFFISSTRAKEGRRGEKRREDSHMNLAYIHF